MHNHEIELVQIGRESHFFITIEDTLFRQTSDEFTVKIAHDLEEITKLSEAGFEYVSDYSGLEVLRQRK